MESFRECGWPAFAALGVGSLAIVLGVVALALALIKPRLGLILGIVALTASLGPPIVGLAGMVLGRQKTDEALAAVSPESVEEIRAMGYHEAGQCVPVGAGIGVLPLVIAAIAIGIGASRKTKESAA